MTKRRTFLQALAGLFIRTPAVAAAPLVAAPYRWQWPELGGTPNVLVLDDTEPLLPKPGQIWQCNDEGTEMVWVDAKASIPFDDIEFPPPSGDWGSLVFKFRQPGLSVADPQANLPPGCFRITKA